MQYVTRPYRYADGVAYRPNLHCIHEFENGQASVRKVGGLVKVGERYLAYAGLGMLVQDKPERIQKVAKAFAWGATKREALMAIRPHL